MISSPSFPAIGRSFAKTCFDSSFLQGSESIPNRKIGLEKRRHEKPKLICKSQLEVKDVNFRPPGSALNLLNNVSFFLPSSSLGVIYGKSGSGKTLLLQLLAGLSTPSSGSISISSNRLRKESYKNLANPSTELQSFSRAELAERAGIVFQFPERYFVCDTVIEELTFGWPRDPQDFSLRTALAARLQAVIIAVGLTKINIYSDPRSLSGGNQRKLALAIQLVRMPQLLLLDEPLAGLDWQARKDVVKVLGNLKQNQTILVVSHDLKELAPLVDRWWHMTQGGNLSEKVWSKNV